MRARTTPLLLVAVALSLLSTTGCGLSKQLYTNLITDPLQWDRYSDGVARHVRDKSLAEDAWDEVCNRDGDVYSRHYKRGFFDGFQDYLNLGGTGDPPTLPPRSYWRIYYQNPEGHEAIQDWFEGFRHGANIARASGVRDFVTLPLSSAPPPETAQTSSENSDEAKASTTDQGKKPEVIPNPGNKTNDKDGPVKQGTPPKTANGKPMPVPAPPIIQVERMIAPPVPNRAPQPKPE